MSTDPATLERARLHAEICRVLTDPKRLLLLQALHGADRTVGELAAEIGATLPNASQHLAVLRSAGLVDGQREGASVRYRLAEPAIIDACDIVESIVDRRLVDRAVRAARTANTATAANPVAASTPATSGTSAAVSAVASPAVP